MLLAFCIYKYFPFGGLQRDFLQIAKACQAQGHQIRIYVMSWQGEIPSNIEIIQVPQKGLTNHSKNQHYATWVHQHLLAHPVDKVVGFNKMPGLDVYFAGDSCYAEKVSHKGFFYKLSKRCRHYLAFEDAVFNPVSKTQLMMLTKKQITEFKQHYHTQDNRFHLLPPGIAMDRKYHQGAIEKRQQFRASNHLGDSDFIIIQIGSDFKRKGVDRSLYAIAQLPDELKQRVTYLIVGQDKPEPYQKLAKSLNIDKQIRFYSGRNDIPDFLFAADLLLHPARQEAAGMVLIEALAAGVPVIVSGISGYAYHIADAKAGIVLSEPYTQSELNNALHIAITDKMQRDDWHQHAIDYSEKKDLYHLAKCAAHLILDSANHE